MNERLETMIKRAAWFDRSGAIRGQFTIESLPDIYSPRFRVPTEAQIACVGLVVPVRFPDLIRDDFMSVLHCDLIASLLLQDREEQADLFEIARQGVRQHELVEWEISPDVGRVAIGPPLTTDDYYRKLEANVPQVQ